jgi:hypothetical protein
MFPLLEGPSYEVNNRLCPSSNEEKTCVVLASTSTKYEVSKMAIGYNQATLHRMLLFLSFCFLATKFVFFPFFVVFLFLSKTNN